MNRHAKRAAAKRARHTAHVDARARDIVRSREPKVPFRIPDYGPGITPLSDDVREKLMRRAGMKLPDSG